MNTALSPAKFHLLVLIMVAVGSIFGIPLGATLAASACFFLLAKCYQSVVVENIENYDFLKFYFCCVAIHYVSASVFTQSPFELYFYGPTLIALPMLTKCFLYVGDKIGFKRLTSTVYALIWTVLFFIFTAMIGSCSNYSLVLFGFMPGLIYTGCTASSTLGHIDRNEDIYTYFFALGVAPVFSIYMFGFSLLLFENFAPKSISATCRINALQSSEDGRYVIIRHSFGLFKRTTCYLPNGEMRELADRETMWPLSMDSNPVAHPWHAEFSSKQKEIKVRALDGSHFSVPVESAAEVVAYTRNPPGFVFEQDTTEYDDLFFFDIQSRRLRKITNEPFGHHYDCSVSGDGNHVFIEGCWCKTKSEKSIWCFSPKVNSVQKIWSSDKGPSPIFIGPGPNDAIILRAQKAKGNDQSKVSLLRPSGEMRELKETAGNWPIMAPNGRSYVYFKDISSQRRELTFGNWSESEKKYINNKPIELRSNVYRDDGCSIWSADSKRFCFSRTTPPLVFDNTGVRVELKPLPKGEISVKGFWGSRWLVIEEKYGQVHLIDLDGNKDAILNEQGIFPRLVDGYVKTKRRTWLKGLVEDQGPTYSKPAIKSSSALTN